MKTKQQIIDLVEAKQQIFTEASDQIWEYAETRFQVSKSAAVLCNILEQQGFKVEKGIANMEHAFVATYGSGKPVIGILAEYDALANLSQISDLPQKEFQVENGSGHGCGHQALGAGAVAGAVGIKDFMEISKMEGTIKLLGCPAEESGYGKAFMAREGVFNDLDTILTWHPMDNSSAWGNSTLAVYQLYFKFKGVSAHASAAPEYGRSALDAAELMNIGVNFLREHMIDTARIHYAFIDVGGQSANVVQPTASLHYFIRAPKAYQVQQLYERVVKIAQGAALMTETELEIEWDSACTDYLVNKTMTEVMYHNLKLSVPASYTKEELEYEQKFFDTLNEASRQSLYNTTKATYPGLSPEEIQEISNKPINDVVCPLSFTDKAMPASTDVGDASWISPTAQVCVACVPHGTPPHSWQWVATGKSSIMHKGLIAAGKTIALTAYDILTNPDLVEKAKKEHLENLGGQTYRSAIPKEVMPK